ncbi:MAG TPA: hypothetical protein IAC41_06845 [Candidatus Merdenecus merdavium]|nr:hypothetical protein [Candidatus Merdenecus merdavium]
MDQRPKNYLPPEKYEMGKKQKIYAASFRENSAYDDKNKARPDNNIFFEERSNPLSSKGN